jgi:hypothetical protein
VSQNDHQLYLRLHLLKDVLMSLSNGKRVGYFTPDSKPYSLSYGQWTVKWWEWFISIGTEANPAVDSTGEHADINQRDPDVWFLAGTLGGNSVKRRCVIPSGKSVLFPVINYEMNTLERPELKTENELIKHVEQDIDDILNLEAIIDSQAIPTYRVRSDPLVFTLRIPDDNVFEVSGGGTTQATSDGYWVFLKPLVLGEHQIYFAGSCSAGSRNVRASYDLTVTH